MGIKINLLQAGTCELIKTIFMKLNTMPMSPFIEFSRKEWACLRHSEPMTLTESELMTLKGINEDLSLDEVAEIYLPLSRLLNLYINSNIQRHTIVEQFLGYHHIKIPYVIGIAGSVAVGKSTTARVLQALLSRWTEHRKVALVTTDGFLYPNAYLNKNNLMEKKGFPESYDIQKLLTFIAQIKSGAPLVSAPIYSHLTYDIIPDQQIVIEQPDIVILEGLNILQIGSSYDGLANRPFISDYLDFSIYVDAQDVLLEEWYISRFLKLRESAFSDPAAYFHHYSSLSESEATETARTIWQRINHKNLRENILPTRERASLIMTKGANHAIERVNLRK